MRTSAKELVGLRPDAIFGVTTPVIGDLADCVVADAVQVETVIRCGCSVGRVCVETKKLGVCPSRRSRRRASTSCTRSCGAAPKSARMIARVAGKPRRRCCSPTLE